MNELLVSMCYLPCSVALASYLNITIFSLLALLSPQSQSLYIFCRIREKKRSNFKFHLIFEFSTLHFI